MGTLVCGGQEAFNNFIIIVVYLNCIQDLISHVRVSFLWFPICSSLFSFVKKGRGKRSVGLSGTSIENRDERVYQKEVHPIH